MSSRRHRRTFSDDMTVQTVETITFQTPETENVKIVGDKIIRPLSTQVRMDDKSLPDETTKLKFLEECKGDLNLRSIHLQEMKLPSEVSRALVHLIREDDQKEGKVRKLLRRQKNRWESITLEDVQNDEVSVPSELLDHKRDMRANIVEAMGSMEGLLSCIFNVDNCDALYLSSLRMPPSLRFSLQALYYSQSLKTLQLDFMDLTSLVHDLSKCVSRNTSLKALTISRCGLSDDSLEIILKRLPPQLTELRIFGNKCRSKGLVAAVDYLTRPDSKLEILDLSYQHLTNENENDQQGEKKTFCFDFALLSTALATNCTLKVLDLDHCSVRDEQLAQLVSALCINSTLEELMLNHNQITDVGAERMSSQFPFMQGLRRVSMYSNRITKEIFYDEALKGDDATTSTASTSSRPDTPSTPRSMASVPSTNPQDSNSTPNQFKSTDTVASEDISIIEEEYEIEEIEEEYVDKVEEEGDEYFTYLAGDEEIVDVKFIPNHTDNLDSFDDPMALTRKQSHCSTGSGITLFLDDSDSVVSALTLPARKPSYTPMALPASNGSSHQKRGAEPDDASVRQSSPPRRHPMISEENLSTGRSSLEKNDHSRLNSVSNLELSLVKQMQKPMISVAALTTTRSSLRSTNPETKLPSRSPQSVPHPIVSVESLAATRSSLRSSTTPMGSTVRNNNAATGPTLPVRMPLVSPEILASKKSSLRSSTIHFDQLLDSSSSPPSSSSVTSKPLITLESLNATRSSLRSTNPTESKASKRKPTLMKDVATSHPNIPLMTLETLTATRSSLKSTKNKTRNPIPTSKTSHQSGVTPSPQVPILTPETLASKLSSLKSTNPTTPKRASKSTTEKRNESVQNDRRKEQFLPLRTAENRFIVEPKNDSMGVIAHCSTKSISHHHHHHRFTQPVVEKDPLPHKGNEKTNETRNFLDNVEAIKDDEDDDDDDHFPLLEALLSASKKQHNQVNTDLPKENVRVEDTKKERLEPETSGRYQSNRHSMDSTSFQVKSPFQETPSTTRTPVTTAKAAAAATTTNSSSGGDGVDSSRRFHPTRLESPAPSWNCRRRTSTNRKEAMVDKNDNHLSTWKSFLEDEKRQEPNTNEDLTMSTTIRTGSTSTSSTSSIANATTVTATGTTNPPSTTSTLWTSPSSRLSTTMKTTAFEEEDNNDDDDDGDDDDYDEEDQFPHLEAFLKAFKQQDEQ